MGAFPVPAPLHLWRCSAPEDYDRCTFTGLSITVFYSGISINFAVSLNLFSFQLKALLSFSPAPFPAGEESLGDKATAIV